MSSLGNTGLPPALGRCCGLARGEQVEELHTGTCGSLLEPPGLRHVFRYHEIPEPFIKYSLLFNAAYSNFKIQPLNNLADSWKKNKEKINKAPTNKSPIEALAQLLN